MSDAGLAQLVEQRIRNAWVGGSIPLTGTIKKSSSRRGFFYGNNQDRNRTREGSGIKSTVAPVDFTARGVALSVDECNFARKIPCKASDRRMVSKCFARTYQAR